MKTLSDTFGSNTISEQLENLPRAPKGYAHWLGAKVFYRGRHWPGLTVEHVWPDPEMPGCLRVQFQNGASHSFRPDGKPTNPPGPWARLHFPNDYYSLEHLSTPRSA